MNRTGLFLFIAVVILAGAAYWYYTTKVKAPEGTDPAMSTTEPATTPAPTDGTAPAPTDGTAPAPTDGTAPAPTDGSTPPAEPAPAPAPTDGTTPPAEPAPAPAPSGGSGGQ